MFINQHKHYQRIIIYYKTVENDFSYVVKFHEFFSEFERTNAHECIIVEEKTMNDPLVLKLSPAGFV